MVGPSGDHPPTGPFTPGNVTATAGQINIVLTWDALATGTAVGYRVEYGVHMSDDLTTAEFTAAQTSFTHSDNAEGTTYQYRLQTHNAAGHSTWSDIMTTTRSLRHRRPPTQPRLSAAGP